MAYLDFTGKTVGITGSTGALGSYMAKVFAKNGANVAVLGNNVEKGKAVADEIKKDGGKAEFFPFNVCDDESIKTGLKNIADTFGGIDIWINNAGVNVPAEERFHVDKFSDEWWKKIVSVDMDGVYKCSKHVVPYLRGRKGSNIINISSVVGMVPFRNQVAFTAAKAGVVNMTKAMALELADDDIRVNCIAPGTICMDKTAALWAKDDSMKRLLDHIPQHRQGDPDEIAYPTLFIADSYMSGYITGQCLAVDGGWTCGYARDF